MNQILMTNNGKSYKNKATSSSVSSIVRFFAIVILFFGIILVGHGSYAMVKSMTSTPPAPSISVEQVGSNVILKIDSSTPIKQVAYSINGVEVSIQGRNRTEIGENLDLVLGENKIKVQVTDKNGNITTTEQVYNFDNAPTIEFSGDGKKAKITVRDDMQISSIEYWWDDDEANKKQVELPSDATKIFETKVDIDKGERTLHVVAKDNNGNKSEGEQKYKGTTKPTIEVTQDGNEAVITVKDDIGIKTVEYQVNKNYDKKEEAEGEDPKKEIQYSIPLEEGENGIAVRVTNTDGLTSGYVVRYNN